MIFRNNSKSLFNLFRMWVNPQKYFSIRVDIINFALRHGSRGHLIWLFTMRKREKKSSTVIVSFSETRKKRRLCRLRSESQFLARVPLLCKICLFLETKVICHCNAKTKWKKFALLFCAIVRKIKFFWRARKVHDSLLKYYRWCHVDKKPYCLTKYFSTVRIFKFY